MNSPIPRRRFFSSAVALAAASTLGRSAKASAKAASLPSSSHPRLLIGCCAYSYRQYLEKGQMTMEDFILKGVELGIHAVDMTTYWFKSTEPAYLLGLRRFAQKNGMPFSGTAIGTDMCRPKPEERAQELAKIKRWIDATALLGASHLRVFGGEIPEGASLGQAIQWVVEIMKQACDYAAEKGVILGIESHGGITSKAATITEILGRVNSPYAGINLDIANFTENEYAQIEEALPYTSHAHVRDLFSESRQPIDLDRVWQIFAKGGYRGYMSAEYESEEDPMTGVPKLIAKMKDLSRKYSSV